MEGRVGHEQREKSRRENISSWENTTRYAVCEAAMYFKAGNGGATQSCLQVANKTKNFSLQLKMYFPPRPPSLMRCLYNC